MNLYKYHTNPEQLQYSYKDALDNVPELAWREFFYSAQLNELRKREHLWTESAEYAYKYAKEVLRKPFPAGEAVIAKSPSYSHFYAIYVLEGPFPAGEPAISINAGASFWYAVDVLKARFTLGEPAIAWAIDANPKLAEYMDMFGLKLVDGEFVPA